MMFELWEMEIAYAAAENAMRAATYQAMCIPRHIIIEGHNRYIEQLGNNTLLTGSPQPRHGTSSPPGIVGHGGNDG